MKASVNNARVACESQQFGGVCVITCRVGFWVDGVEGLSTYQRTCTADGVWNGSSVVCRSALSDDVVFPSHLPSLPPTSSVSSLVSNGTLELIASLPMSDNR